MKECKYCKWYKIGNKWVSICLNPQSINEDCACVAADKYEPQECDDKEDEE